MWIVTYLLKGFSPVKFFFFFFNQLVKLITSHNVSCKKDSFIKLTSSNLAALRFLFFFSTFFFNLFLLVGGQLLYNIVVGFVIHWHESAMDLHVFPIPIPSHLLLHPIPLGLPSAPAPSTCIMHPTWAGDLFHYR